MCISMYMFILKLIGQLGVDKMDVVFNYYIFLFALLTIVWYTVIMKKLIVDYNTNICGIIDSRGAVHSISNQNGEGLLFHHNFGMHWNKGFRWCFNGGLTSSVINDENFNIGDLDKIERHLTRKYGIEFWENGYHNINQFKKQLKDKQ